MRMDKWVPMQTVITSSRHPISVCRTSARNSAKKLSTTKDIAGESGPDAYELVEELLKLKSDVKLYRGGTADGFLKCMISDISIDTQESELFAKNFQNLKKTIENQRASVSGVDEARRRWI